MGRKSSWQFDRSDRERREKAKMDPRWRGIGCLLVVMTGVFGYLFANWFLTQNAINRWLYIPPVFMNPDIPVIGSLLGGGNLVRFTIALLFLLIAFGIMNVAWAIFVPVQPGEYDIPALKRRRARRR